MTGFRDGDQVKSPIQRLSRATTFLPLVLGLICAGCQTIKPYQKEHLLNPLMDDKGLSGLSSPFAGAALTAKDFLASGSPQASASTSCPTCGG